MCSDFSLNSSICVITVVNREIIVKIRLEYSHQKCGVPFDVSETFPTYFWGSILLLYYFDIILRLRISNSFVCLVSRVSIDQGTRAPSHSSPVSELICSSLLVVFHLNPQAPLYDINLSTFCAFLCLIGLLHRNQRQHLQLHQAVSPHTPIGYEPRFSAARTSRSFRETSSRESAGATRLAATVVVTSADIGAK